MITIAEISKWTGITVFEALLHVIAILIAAVVLVLKNYAVATISFYGIFAPLLVASALNCYLIFIIFVRLVVEDHDVKRAFAGTIFNFMRAVMLFIFEYVLCSKLSGNLERTPADWSYSVILIPIWILITMMGIQACRLL